MKQIQIDFQNKKIYFDLDNDNYNNHIRLKKELKIRYNLNEIDYYITTRSKLISNDWNFNENEECYYQVHLKVRGGFINQLVKIVQGIGKIAKLVIKIPDFVVWLVEVILWIITEVLNPIKFFKDLALSILSVIKLLISGVLDLITGVVKYIVNTIFSPVIAGFWGYTPARENNTFCIISNANKNENFIITKKSKNDFDKIFKPGNKVIIQSNNDSKYQVVNIVNSEIFSGTTNYGTTKVIISQPLNGNYTSGSTLSIPNKYGTGENKGNCGKKKCVNLNPLNQLSGSGNGIGISFSLPKSQNDIPISVIITTILMPPLGLFMEFGFKGWINIGLCALLTTFYYFPGLIYALIIIFC
jgi:uncharacterized membrane protein YqaE (UPF0057 family)